MGGGGMKDRFSGLEPPGTWYIHVFVSREPPSGVQKVSTETQKQVDQTRLVTFTVMVDPAWWARGGVGPCVFTSWRL